MLRGVHFDFNKSKIRPGDAAILDEAVEILKAHPDVNIYVDGYCDAIGSEEYNLKLSQRRADAVAKYLEDHGHPGLATDSARLRQDQLRRLERYRRRSRTKSASRIGTDRLS